MGDRWWWWGRGSSEWNGEDFQKGGAGLFAGQGDLAWVDVNIVLYFIRFTLLYLDIHTLDTLPTDLRLGSEGNIHTQQGDVSDSEFTHHHRRYN